VKPLLNHTKISISRRTISPQHAKSACAKREIPARCQIFMSFKQWWPEAHTGFALSCPPSKVCAPELQRRDLGHTAPVECLGLFVEVAATVGVTAQAGYLHSASDPGTVVAAILRIIGRNAGTGCIRAFLGISHRPPLPVSLAPLRAGYKGVRCQNRSKGQ